MSGDRPDRFEPQIRMVGGRRMQCKDIPDGVFLDAVRRTPGTDSRPGAWRMRWDVQAELEQVTGWLPINLFLAKAAGLMRRGLLGGCPCGCRGDYHLPADCDGGQYCCQRGKARRLRELVGGSFEGLGPLLASDGPWETAEYVGPGSLAESRELGDLVAQHVRALREEMLAGAEARLRASWAASNGRYWSGPDKMDRRLLRAYGLSAAELGLVRRSAFSPEYRRRQRARVRRRRR